LLLLHLSGMLTNPSFLMKIWGTGCYFEEIYYIYIFFCTSKPENKSVGLSINQQHTSTWTKSCIYMPNLIPVIQGRLTCIQQPAFNLNKFSIWLSLFHYSEVD
jgi:hypothetical protein